ncbi:MAG TPA: T9SS type A sorting domain-containing protein [Cyclobacteriaceae bacterium]|nr:T9SS type A sorting domain-containing protein [Cyclobacteriaceae bacterium]
MKTYFSLIGLLLYSSLLYSQTITKTTSSVVSGTVCPVSATWYEVSVPSGLTSCQINWSATNGTATKDPNNQRKAKVVWNDTPGASGTVTATFVNCSNESKNGTTANKTELILSVKNQAWGSYGTSVNVDYCTKAQVYLTVPRMFVQGTGGIAQPPRVEVAYAWTLPAGWKEVGTGRTGFFGTPTNFITIEPIDCSKPGNVTVYGTLDGAGPFCNLAAPSATATINLNGLNPAVAIGPQPGYTGGTICDITPVNFTASMNAVFGCVTGYKWEFPSSWKWRDPADGQLKSSPITTATNSISLTPDGSANISQPIKVSALFACGSQVSSGSYVPPFKKPKILGTPLVCTTNTFTLQNVNSLPVTWSSSNNLGLTINASGVATRVNNFNGAVTITATLGGSCNPPFVLRKSVWVGIPTITYNPGGPDLCSSPPTYMGPRIEGLTYLWSIDDPNITLLQETLPISFVLSRTEKYFNMSLTISGETCSTSNTIATYTDDLYCQCFSDPTCPNQQFSNLFYVYPNPSSEFVDITVNEASPENEKIKEFEVTLIDNSGNKLWVTRSMSKKARLATNSYLPGTYILEISYKDGKQRRQLLIKR